MTPGFTLVTGNQHKLAEYKRLLPADLVFNNASIDLEEIQSLDSKVIIEHKVRIAYERIGSPVIVEDVSAGLDTLNGLPGPFIKFFEERLGKGALYQLAGQEVPATVTCTIGYYDGEKLLFSEGVIHGHVVAPRGEEGHGFDFSFVPDNHTQTFAEMGPSEKDKVSHRALAVQELLATLK